MQIPYDGGASGEFIGDAMRRLQGNYLATGLYYSYPEATGVFSIYETYSYRSLYDTTFRDAKGIAFDNEGVVPTANENRPTSISCYVYLSY